MNYSKWDHIEVSDDEDDTHPNIDTGSLFRWRHQARVDRMAELDAEKQAIAQKKAMIDAAKREVKTKESVDADAGKKLEALKLEEQKIRAEEDEVRKKEKAMPLNVDTLSKAGFTKTIINKPKPRPDNSHLSEEEREELYRKFIQENEPLIKKYAMLSKWDDCKKFLGEHQQLTCEDTANYLAIWCLNLEMEEKHDLMEHVSKQVVTMQYILELAKQLDCDPRACVAAFFTRIQKAEKEYMEAFEDELKSFKHRIRERAKAKLQAIMEEIEEEERQKRLGPGGLDPAEVFESLPKEMQDCFEKRDIGQLQTLIDQLSKADAEYHMRRCVDSGLWIPDAKAAGMTPASEELAASTSAGEEPVYDELQPKAEPATSEVD